MSEGPESCTIFCFDVQLRLNILPGTFYWPVAQIHLQICCSLCTVKAKVSTKNSNREVSGASNKII